MPYEKPGQILEILSNTSVISLILACSPRMPYTMNLKVFYERLLLQNYNKFIIICQREALAIVVIVYK